MKKRHFLSLLILIAFATLFLASATQKQVTTTQAPFRAINFNYDLKTTAQAGSADIGIILIKPVINARFKLFYVQPFTDFQGSMQGDIEEIITGRGFTFRGPYSSYDEITYSDKKATHLVVEVLIDPTIQELTPNPWTRHSKYHFVPYGNGYYTYTYTFDCDVTLSGKIKITFSEIMSNEKINIKNLEIPITPFHAKSTAEYPKSSVKYLLNDPGFFNPLVDALNVVYDHTLDKIHGFFDPDELESWKPQIEELRGQKRY